MDIAELGFRADTSNLKEAEGDLKRLASTAEKTERSAEGVGRSFDKGAQGVDRFGKEVQQTERQVESANRDLQAMARNSAATGNAMGGMAGHMRGASMQLSQVAQQGAVTGNYLQALMVQAPDLALGFGTVGIAVGALIPVLYGAAQGMGIFGESAEDAEKRLEELADAVDAVSSAQKAASQNPFDLAKTYGAATEEARELLRLQQRIAEVEAQEAADEGLGRVSDAIRPGALDALRGYANDARGAVRRLERDFDLTNQQAFTLLTIFEGLSETEGASNQASALRGARETMQAMVGTYGEMNEEQRTLYDMILQTEKATLQLAAATLDAKGESAAHKAIAEDMIADLAEQADMQKLIARYGEDSVEVTEARVAAEREAFAAQVETLQIAEDLKAELMRAWEAAEGIATVDISAGIQKAVGAAQELTGWLAKGLEALGEMGSGSVLDRLQTGFAGVIQGAQDAFQAGLNGQLSPYSNRAIGDPHSQFDRTGVDPSALRALSLLEQAANMTFKINSAHRDAAHNAAVGGANKSQHIQGRAFDIDASEMTRAERTQLIRMARQAGFGGVGVYNNSLHFDTGAQRAWGGDYSSRSVPAWAAGALKTPKADATAKNVDALAKSFDGLMASLDPTVAIMQRYEEAQKTINDALASGKITQEEATEAHALASERLEDDLAAVEEQGRAAYNSLLAAVDPATAALMELEKAQRDVNEALQSGAISADEASHAMALAQERYNTTIARLQEKAQGQEFDALSNGIDQVADALANAIVNGENLGEALGAVFRQIAADLISSGIKELLKGVLMPSGGGGGGLLGNMLGGIFGGFRADGGPVDPSEGYIVGENGPEWFQPKTAGDIISNANMAASQAANMARLQNGVPMGMSRATTGGGIGKEDLAGIVAAIRATKPQVVVIDDPAKIGRYLRSAEGGHTLAVALKEIGR